MGLAKKNENNRIYFVFFGMLAIGIAIFAKMSIIQFKEGEHWRSKADSLTIKDQIIPANRGNIYSADGSLLATSIPKYTVYFDPMSPSRKNFEKYIEPFSDSLAKFIPEKSASEYKSYFRKARSNQKRYIHIATKLSYTQYMKLKSFPLFNLGKYKGGMIVNQVNVREYPMGMIANRTIGYERVNDDKTITRKGIEAAFTDYLTGKEGRRKVQKMSKNLWKPIHDENEIEPQDGYDITTTIDVYIQDIAHHALLSSLEYYEADHGTVVVMETNTGEVKAISNLGKIGDGSYRETINYAVLERQDPGSTFKLASYLALLDDGKADTATIYDTHNGVVTFSNRRVTDSNRRGYGKISLARGFEVSSNTVVTQAVYQAYKDHPKDFTDKLKTFGFNGTLGIDLKGEPASYIPVPGDRNWSKIALPWMAYGYGILVTPLQTLTLYNAVANNGEMVKPQFVKEIKDVHRTIRTFDKEVINPQIVKPEVIKKMQTVLKNVVLRGTGKRLYSPDFSMAGKTGTAQMNYGKAKGGMYYASSFVGYFPADNPKYSCIVVIHRPTKHSYYGGDVAGPVFKRIAQKIFTDVPSVNEIKDIESPLPKAVKSYKNYYARVKQSGNIMPDVVGLPAMDAVAILENLGLKVQTAGTGKVIRQSVKNGEKITKQQTITLELS
ncbi:penicillin-binding protein [Flavobacterium dauae]|uniref:penicillin-binding protein n=1 Tax=Flavobacterium dauae TaxID=1563479 RepID=UPI00101B3DBC|nr:penicillin-binding protein [Flavobacterium dauae]WLD24070.1 penicillin-binding protein [Flavobacterium dauae]